MEPSIGSSYEKSSEKLTVSSPNLDQTQVLAMLDEKMQTMRAEAPTAISKIAEFSDTLTDTQRAELLQMIEKFSKHKRHGGRHH